MGSMVPVPVQGILTEVTVQTVPASSSSSYNLDIYSRYVNTPVYQLGGTIFFGLVKFPTLDLDVSDRYYQVDQSQQGRLDVISYNLYGTAELYWFIANYNNITNVMFRPLAGEVLRAPTLDRIISAITAQQGSNG